MNFASHAPYTSPLPSTANIPTVRPARHMASIALAVQIAVSNQHTKTIRAQLKHPEKKISECFGLGQLIQASCMAVLQEHGGNNLPETDTAQVLLNIKPPSQHLRTNQMCLLGAAGYQHSQVESLNYTFLCSCTHTQSSLHALTCHRTPACTDRIPFNSCAHEIDLNTHTAADQLNFHISIVLVALMDARSRRTIKCEAQMKEL